MSPETAKPTVVSIANSSWKSGNGVSGHFPVGLRVLVVDDDKTCLRVLNCMLRKCGYEVTQKCDAESALDLLRNNKNGYDIVISDVHMPDMDGFKLLEHIGLEMDLPVIMMSADDRKDIVWKGVTHGACDYLIKPISIEALKNIWQHVVRKKKQELKEKDFEGSVISEDGEQQQKSPENVDYSSSANGTNCKNLKKKRDEEDEEDRDDTSNVKKPRVVWSNDLHEQFVNAVNQLGIERAVPKKILELMDVPGLTRENVASHLQKFRLYLKKAAQHESLSNPFMGLQDASYGTVSSINGHNLQALTSTGQTPSQSLCQIPSQRVATFQGVALARPISSMPIDDQRNIFRFGTPTLQPFAHSSEGMNVQVNSRAQMVQRQSQMTHTFDHINGGDHVSNLAGQPNLLQVIPSGVRGPAYSTLSHPSTPPGDSFVSTYDDFGGVGNCPNNIEQVNSSLVDNLLRMKCENVQNNPFPGQYTDDDVFSSYLKQQEGLGPVENEFHFDGCHTNNFPL